MALKGSSFDPFAPRVAGDATPTELTRLASPMPGVPKVRLVSEGGNVLEEGYYAFHAARMPGADVELSAEDCEHYIVVGQDDDWDRPCKIGLMRLVDSGIGASLEVVRGDE